MTKVKKRMDVNEVAKSILDRVVAKTEKVAEGKRNVGKKTNK